MFFGTPMRHFLNVLLLAGLFFASSQSLSTAQSAKGLFGSTEFKSTELSAFKKWAAIRSRHQNELGPTTINAANIPCRRTENFKCASEEWQDVMRSLKSRDANVQLETINRHLNSSPYITDMVNWQQKDYWATLKQFFRKNGDCEDYAIAKYYSLKELGFSADQMRIVIVRDKNLNVAHAVLAVYEKDKIWILDNQISHIISEDKIVHYEPLYSINENAWWLHKVS